MSPGHDTDGGVTHTLSLSISLSPSPSSDLGPGHPALPKQDTMAIRSSVRLLRRTPPAYWPKSCHCAHVVSVSVVSIVSGGSTHCFGRECETSGTLHTHTCSSWSSLSNPSASGCSSKHAGVRVRGVGSGFQESPRDRTTKSRAKDAAWPVAINLQLISFARRELLSKRRPTDPHSSSSAEVPSED